MKQLNRCHWFTAAVIPFKSCLAYVMWHHEKFNKSKKKMEIVKKIFAVVDKYYWESYVLSKVIDYGRIWR